MALRPLKNSILFSFIDENAGGKFIPTTRSGILLTNQAYDHQRDPRWGRALAVGPDCVDVKAGDLILVEPLKWTTGFKHDEVMIWKTDENNVAAITNDINECIQF